MTSRRFDDAPRLIRRLTTRVEALEKRPKPGGPWQTFTGTTANITETSGTKVARYRRNGKSIEGYFHFTFGASSAMGTGPTLTLPVEASSSYVDFHPVGNVALRDATGNIHVGVLRLNGSSRTVGDIRVNNAAGTTTIQAQVNSTSPFTWTTSDVVMVTFSYEAA